MLAWRWLRRAAGPKGRACTLASASTALGSGGRICDAAGFCWTDPWPQGNHLFGVWVSPACEVWRSAIWTRSCALTVKRGRCRPTSRCSRFWGIWGRTRDDIWAVGTAGPNVYHFDGQMWSPSDSGTTKALTSILGLCCRRFLVGGRSGTVVHFDGVAWSPVLVDTQQALSSVWGAGRGDVWIAGAQSTVLHGDGQSFSQR